MRKIGKIKYQQFIKTVIKEITDAKFLIEEDIKSYSLSCRKWNTTTSIGDVAITLYLDTKDNYSYCVYIRFDDPILANRKFNCGTSGKYNILTGNYEHAIGEIINFIDNLKPLVDISAVRNDKINNILSI